MQSLSFPTLAKCYRVFIHVARETVAWRWQPISYKWTIISPTPWFTMHWHVRLCIADTVAVLQCYSYAVAQRDNYRARPGLTAWTRNLNSPQLRFNRNFNTLDKRGIPLCPFVRGESCKMKNFPIASRRPRVVVTSRNVYREETID